jgi:CBS domain-containing protein
MITQTIGDIVRDKQRQGLVSVTASAKVGEAVAAMSRQQVGAVVVRGDNGEVEGIFTERDVVCRVADEGRDPKLTPIAEVMSRQVRHVDPSTTVDEALRLMLLHRHRHLLVMEGSRVDGLVSIRDLMYAMVRPDEPIAHEGRPGVIRARAEDALRAIQDPGPGGAQSR